MEHRTHDIIPTIFFAAVVNAVITARDPAVPKQAMDAFRRLQTKGLRQCGGIPKDCRCTLLFPLQSSNAIKCEEFENNTPRRAFAASQDGPNCPPRGVIVYSQAVHQM